MFNKKGKLGGKNLSILGLLKSSSFEKGSNGETYCEQLKQGKFHFSKPFDFTSEDLSRAQQALEDSTNFVKLNNNCHESGPTFFYTHFLLL